MSRSKGKQHWYQVHKARAGSASVAKSQAVLEFKARVQEIDSEISLYRRQVEETLFSSIRRFLFGLNSLPTLMSLRSAPAPTCHDRRNTHVHAGQGGKND
jgi:hypothetical protein